MIVNATRKAVSLALTAFGAALMFSALGETAMADPTFPEIDPGSLAGAVTLLSGGLCMLIGRRGR